MTEPEEMFTEDSLMESDVIKDYDREILKKMIQEEMDTLRIMEEYWRENQPWTYTKHKMKLDAYQMLMEYHDSMKKERNTDES